MNIKYLTLLLCLALFKSVQGQVFRGINVNAIQFATPVNSNTLMLKATGADVIRLSFGYTPLINKTAPYKYNLTAFNYLENALNFCEANNIRVIIDPHTIPGTASNYTMDPTDPFWTEPVLQSYLYALWDTLAVITKDRGNVIYGLDLMNEPALPCCNTNIWNDMVATLTANIRNKGNQHPIIVEPFSYINGAGQYISRINSMPLLNLPDDNNLIVSPHFYVPNAFTHQGVSGNPSGYEYPGTINGVFYDKSVLDNRMQPIVNFQNAHDGIRILLGEFSASRIGGTYSNTYLSDVIDLLESYGWDWAYHEFRGSSIWDAEMPVGSNDPAPRDTSQPRMKTLMQYFRLTNIPLPMKLLSFGMSKSGNENIIKWQLSDVAPYTAVELEISYDGYNFQMLQKDVVPVNMKTYQGQYTQSHYDRICYYRLKIKEANGQYFYSGIISFAPVGTQDIFVYPTLVDKEVRINMFNETGIMNIQLFNINGQLLYNKTAGQGVTELDMSDYVPGIYVLKVGNTVKKLIKR